MTELWNVIDDIDVVCILTRHWTENAERDSEQNGRDDNEIWQREIALENERVVIAQRIWKKFSTKEKTNEEKHVTVTM